MNFLAHLHLSGDREKLMVGNFLGDFSKASFTRTLPEGMRAGVQLHHTIDEYTDVQPEFKRTVELLRHTQGKYAPVIADIFYDHFLAANWSAFHGEPLSEFSRHCYEILSDHKSYFPEKARRFFNYLQAGDVLYRYSEIEGIRFVLGGLSKRAAFDNNMSEAHRDLKIHFQEIEGLFMRFYPKLQSRIEEERRILEKKIDT